MEQERGRLERARSIKTSPSDAVLGLVDEVRRLRHLEERIIKAGIAVAHGHNRVG